MIIHGVRAAAIVIAFFLFFFPFFHQCFPGMIACFVGLCEMVDKHKSFLQELWGIHE